MASRRRTVELEFVVDDKQARGKLSNIERSAGQTATGFGKAGSAIKTGFALVGTAAIADFARDSVQSFSELEQSIGGTEAVFGDARGAIDDFAAHSAESIGLAESDFRTATTSIGGQLKRMTGDVDFAAEHSIILTEVGADLAATYGGTTAEAVAALGSAFRGEADPAERFNLNLKIGRVNAKALEMGLAGSTAEIDDHARAQATIALIMEDSADAQGQFAREADTVAGSMQVLNARMEDFKAQLGGELVPVVEEATKKGMNFLDAFDQDVNLGWSQRLSAAMQTVLGDSTDSVQAYIEQKSALNDLGENAETAAPRFSTLGGEMGQIPSIQEDVAETAEEAAAKTKKLAAEEDRAAESAKRHREALLEKREALQNIHDPLTQMIDQTEALEEAEDAVAEAEKEYGEDSAEYRDAVLDRAGIIGDLEQTLKDLKANGIDPTGEAARIMLQGLGIPDPVIDGIFAQFDELERNFEGRRFNMTITTPDIRARSDGSWTKVGDRNFFHEGGVVPGTPGSDVPIMAQAGETIGRRAGGGGGGDVTVHVHGTVISERDLAETIRRELLQTARRNGSTGLF